MEYSRYVIVVDRGIITHTCSAEIADNVAKADGGIVLATIPRELAELADSAPNLRLAVVDTNDNERFFVDGVEYDHYRVVKMEEK